MTKLLVTLAVVAAFALGLAAHAARTEPPPSPPPPPFNYPGDIHVVENGTTTFRHSHRFAKGIVTIDNPDRIVQTTYGYKLYVHWNIDAVRPVFVSVVVRDRPQFSSSRGG
jgi:hypothetical protein